MVVLAKLYKKYFFIVMILVSQISLSNNSYFYHVTEENFKKEVEQSELPVFVQLFAIWCPNCKHLAFLITEILNEFKERCVFGSIDIDKNQIFLQDLLQDIFQKHFHILSGFPSVLVFHKGVFKGSFLGFFENKQDLSKKVTETLVSLGC